jgi:predicted dehydrogenase
MRKIYMSKLAGSSRRQFLKAAATAVAFPFIVPASALGRDGKVAPSNRIVLGGIGLGGMGSGNMHAFMNESDAQIVAICDVDRAHRESAAQKVNTKYGNNDCKAYNDFRELIARPDLDALFIALPDHWHAIPVIAGARAGLDIYGEKPFARTIREGRAMVDALKRNARVWQTGSWQRSTPNFHHACELVINGHIGKVHKVEVGLPSGNRNGKRASKQKTPDGLDWDMWLGPAPYRPYCDGIVHWNWRWLMDYSGGQLTDWCGHHVDIAHWGLGLDYTGPVSVEGKGVYPADGLYNTPTNYHFTCKYANGLVMEVADSTVFPMGTKWIGEKGWIHVTRGGQSSGPAEIFSQKIEPGEIRLKKTVDHQRDFLDCVKTRALTVTPAEIAHRSITVGLLGEIAMLTGRKINWDPLKEEIIGDPEASALLGREYRAPWTLMS